MNPPLQRTRIAQVAAHAGVSMGTVSNVINHPARVTAATKRKVQRSIEALNFVPNAAARTLSSGSSRGLGMVLTDIKNSFFIDIARGAQDRAKAADYKLLIVNSNHNQEQQNEYLEFFDHSQTPGVLLTAMQESTENAERLRDHGSRIVMINFRTDPHAFCMVLMDNEFGGYLAARHLLDQGATRLAFVGGSDQLQPVADRRAGVRRAVDESAGASLFELTTANVFEHDGEIAAARLRKKDVDGVVVSTMMSAIGLVEEFGRLEGPQVPNDVLVVACENNIESGTKPRGISAITPPSYAIGSNAMNLLIMEMEENPETHVHQVVTLAPTLTVDLSSSRPDGGVQKR